MNNTDVKQIYFYHDFKKISFDVWKRIIQDLMSYHMMISDLDWVEEIVNTYVELKTYIENNGILLDEIEEQSYLDKISLLNDQIKQLKDLHSDSNITKNKIDDLEKELKEVQDKLDFYLKYVKHNRFVYKNNKKENQLFSKRTTALIIQKNMILNLMDSISFSKKLTLKKLKVIEKRISKEVPFKGFDVILLYKYVKPYINLLITSSDFGYDFLQKNLYLDY